MPISQKFWHITFLVGPRCFLCLTTGSRFLTPDSILLKLTDNKMAPSFSFHTCARTIILSSRIEDHEGFKLELNVLMNEKSFTMA